jgi:uncharacterized protein (TIGR03435 family)
MRDGGGFDPVRLLTFANGQRHALPRGDFAPVEGGPAWIYSDRYELEAKAEGTPSEETMLGPMLQALLEDRFMLKIHHGAREIPVYELTLAKGGLKLHPVQTADCTLLDLTEFPPPRPEPGVNYCRQNTGELKGRILTVDTHATTIDYFSKTVLQWLERPVIDKTGVTGRFDFHFEYGIDENMRGFGEIGPAQPGEPAGPSIFTALQQLGLKLEAAKGPGDFIVVDSLERPSEN